MVVPHDVYYLGSFVLLTGACACIQLILSTYHLLQSITVVACAPVGRYLCIGFRDLSG